MKPINFWSKLKDFFWGRIPTNVSSSIYPRIYSIIKNNLHPVEWGRWVGSTSDGSATLAITAKDIYDQFESMEYELLPGIIRKKIEVLHPKFKIYDENRTKAYNKFSAKFDSYIKDTEGGYSGPNPLDISSTIFGLIVKHDIEFGQHPHFNFLNMDRAQFEDFKKDIYQDEDYKNYKSYRDTLLKDGKDLLKDISKYYNRDLLSPERRKTSLEILIIILTVILVGGTIWTAWTNQDLVKNQILITNKQLESISPLKPTIEVSLDIPKDRKIAVWDIAKIIKNPDGSESFYKTQVRFILNNIGRMNTGFINAYLTNSFIQSPSEHIDNIAGESSAFLEFELWYNKCHEEPAFIKLENGSEIKKYPINTECNFRIGKIPLGWRIFNLTLYCPFCIVPERTYEFRFCIFDESDSSRKICEKEQKTA